MQKVLTAEEMREVDRRTTGEYGIPSIILMENAAHAAAGAIEEAIDGTVAGETFLIICGKGNNGGDGAALARILWTRGADVTVALIGRVKDTKKDAKTNFEIVRKLSEREVNLDQILEGGDIFFQEITNEEEWSDFVLAQFSSFDPDILVDALFGTGLTKPVGGLQEEVAEYIRGFHIEGVEQETLVVSLDVPSGLDADDAQRIGPSACAHLTVTFTAPKPANVLPPASNDNGEVVVAKIGTPQHLIDSSPSQLYVAGVEDARAWMEQTRFTSASYKNRRGHALLVAGSNNYAGAAVLAGNAAIATGVGLVTVATAESARNAIASRMLPEVMTRGVAETTSGAVSEKAFDEINKFIESSIDAVAIGSGLSSSDASTRKLVRRLIRGRRTPVLLDADGLNSLSPWSIAGSEELPIVLTPHEGEFLKLLGVKDRNALKDRVGAVRRFAQDHHVILALKGERSLVAAPDGRVVVIPAGNPGLGKAGNGDTLAGVIAGFMAQAAQMKVAMFETVVAAIYLAALAGDIAAEKHGERSMVATDVRQSFAEAFKLAAGS